MVRASKSLLQKVFFSVYRALPQPHLPCRFGWGQHHSGRGDEVLRGPWGGASRHCDGEGEAQGIGSQGREGEVVQGSGCGDGQEREGGAGGHEVRASHTCGVARG